MKREVGCKEKWTSSFWQVTHNLVYNISGKYIFFLQKVRNFIFDHWEVGGRGTINQSWCRSLLCTWASPPLTSLISFKQSFNKFCVCVFACMFYAFTSFYFIKQYLNKVNHFLVYVFTSSYFINIFQAIFQQGQPFFVYRFVFLPFVTKCSNPSIR